MKLSIDTIAGKTYLEIWRLYFSFCRHCGNSWECGLSRGTMPDGSKSSTRILYLGKFRFSASIMPKVA